MQAQTQNSKNIVIIGGGPSGLIAAEIIAKAGHKVTIYDRMPSLGRKFLMAGRGGLNITHSEPLEKFTTRYGKAESWLEPHIQNFTPQDLRNWCHALGQETYIGTSGRVFPTSMKAAPMLRAWLISLAQMGVQYKPKHSWHGWQNNLLKFTDSEQKIILEKPDATLLALGGASWPKLGSDGSWVKILSEYNVEISPLRAANCGFIVNWTKYFSDKFAGVPLKPVAIKHNGVNHQGEIMITANGIEGGAVYAMSAQIRDDVLANGKATIHLDLRPDMPLNALEKKLQAPRGKQSFSNYLRKCNFSALAVNLLYESEKANISEPKISDLTPQNLAYLIKNLPITITNTTNIDKAISTAGGITQNALNEDFMLNKITGVFAAGEMLNWEAPTGGYLLQGCFSTSIAAAKGILKYLAK